jgi:hypothetical protein
MSFKEPHAAIISRQTTMTDKPEQPTEKPAKKKRLSRRGSLFQRQDDDDRGGEGTTSLQLKITPVEEHEKNKQLAEKNQDEKDEKLKTEKEDKDEQQDKKEKRRLTEKTRDRFPERIKLPNAYDEKNLKTTENAPQPADDKPAATATTHGTPAQFQERLNLAQITGAISATIKGASGKSLTAMADQKEVVSWLAPQLGNLTTSIQFDRRRFNPHAPAKKYVLAGANAPTQQGAKTARPAKAKRTVKSFFNKKRTASSANPIKQYIQKTWGKP